jgi:Glycosyltransferases involved in cell wall biogenesis
MNIISTIPQDELKLISVIVPCYNQASFLPETLDSLLAQTYQNWECLIIDDGSTDHCSEVAEIYKIRDKRFRYFRQDNLGVAAARNNGIKKASGDFIQFLDSDDLIAPDKFFVQLDAFSKNADAYILYGDYACFDEGCKSKFWTYSRVEIEGNPVVDFSKNWEDCFSIPIHCLLYKKSCFEKWGMFDESFTSGKEDWDLHLRFAIGGAQHIYTKGRVAYYRVHKKSMIRSGKLNMQKGRKMLYKKNIFSPDSSVKVRVIFLARYSKEIGIVKFLSKFFNKLKRW